MLLAETLADNLRRVIDSDAKLREISEAEYCHTVLEACEIITSGLEMRLNELEAEEDDDL